MPTPTKPSPTWALLSVFLCAIVTANGCSRTQYRLQADCEAYNVIAERNVDPRWCVADYTIEMDPRSRFVDPCDPDRSPMPLDDPTSHQYMHFVDGMTGWKHWHDNGDRIGLENPAWYDALAEYVEIGEDGSVKLNVDSALRLAYVHSPSHQSELETLYLSALDVSRERFRLDTQFFGGHGDTFGHRGRLLGEQNELTVATDAQLRRDFATAGELLVGFANSFVFEFTGSDANFAASLANFSFIQPLLRGAGRDVALEQLTISERDLLANLRAYSQYREGFYTRVAIGELGVAGPQRGGGSTNLAVFSGQGGVGGYIGLLRQLQQKRNTEDNLKLQDRTLSLLEAHYEGGLIGLDQVDQFRQSFEQQKANLLQIRNTFEFAVEGYKTGTLGLPPDLPIELDDSLIRQFQLVAPEATLVQDSIAELQNRAGELWDHDSGELRDDVGVEEIRQVIADVGGFIEPVRIQLDKVQVDVAQMEQAVPAREKTMADAEKKLAFALDREELRQGLADLTQQVDVAEVELIALDDALTEQAKDDTAHDLVIWLGGFYRFAAENGEEFPEGLADSTQQLELSYADLTTLMDDLSEQTKDATARELVTWLGRFYRLGQGSILVQARARLETVTVEPIDLDSHDAFDIALANRLDFMNGRAALVDSWRRIQFNADALQSVLNVTASGDIRTARNNPVSFRAPMGTMRLGLEFDAPFTRLVERNSYRESLINYQRSRRSFIQSHDSLHLGLRTLLRQIEVHRTNLEIQRGAVAIAIRRVDMTGAAFYAPVRPPQPGQRPAQFGPTAARNSIEALSSLRITQNAFMSVWLEYYAARMRLARELGIMVLDHEGRWIDSPLPDFRLDEALDGENLNPEELPPPPPIPAEWLELVRFLPQDPNAPHAVVESPEGCAETDFARR